MRFTASLSSSKLFGSKSQGGTSLTTSHRIKVLHEWVLQIEDVVEIALRLEVAQTEVFVHVLDGLALA
jgi:hypothetical protein